MLLFVRHKSWYSVVSLCRCNLLPSRIGLKIYQHPGSSCVYSKCNCWPVNRLKTRMNLYKKTIKKTLLCPFLHNFRNSIAFFERFQASTPCPSDKCSLKMKMSMELCYIAFCGLYGYTKVFHIISQTARFNPLTPNDLYVSRTAPLTSKRCILYIYSTNIGTEYFKHALYSPFFFLFKMQFVS